MMPFHLQEHFDDNAVSQKVLSDKPHATAEAHANQVAHHDDASKHVGTDPNQLVHKQTHSTTI